MNQKGSLHTGGGSDTDDVKQGISEHSTGQILPKVTSLAEWNFESDLELLKLKVSQAPVQVRLWNIPISIKKLFSTYYQIHYTTYEYNSISNEYSIFWFLRTYNLYLLRKSKKSEILWNFTSMDLLLTMNQDALPRKIASRYT